MKKSFIIPIIMFSTILLIGCSENTVNAPNNQNENSTVEDTSNNQVNDKIETSSSQNNGDTNTNQSSKKDSYIEKLDDIQAKIDNDYNDKDQLTTTDLQRANDAKYKLWDDALNEIYNDLQNTLSNSDKENLKQEELAWITKKESDAENAKKEAEGGTLEPVLYSQFLADSTKTRCYELVNKYMD